MKQGKFKLIHLAMKHQQDQQDKSRHQTCINDYALMAQVMSVDKSQNFEEAKNPMEWMNAMQEEYESIMDKSTKELTKLPTNKTHIGSK